MAFKQYKKGSTYYGYDPLSGQGFAASTPDSLKKYFPNGFDANAADANFDTSLFDKTPDQLISGPVDQTALAHAAGAAGLSLADYQKLISGGAAVTDEQKNQIYSSLGIPDVEKAAFGAPDKTTEQLYQDAYNAAGLGDIKTKIADVDKTVAEKKTALNTALGTLNENPWLSEASRVGRTGKITELANSDIQNYLDELQQYKDLYDTGLNEVNGVVTRHTTDYVNNQQLAAAHLADLRKKAEDQITAMQSTNEAKLARYAPDYLASAAKSKAPDTLTTGDGSTYRWDSDAGQFVQLSGPKPVSGGTGSDGHLTDAQIVTTVNQIAGAFDNEPIVKNYNTAAEGYNTLKSIGTSSNSPTDDIAFIYAFAKLMDPNSAVREGEYNTVQRYAQSWADSFGFKANRIFSNTNFLSSDAKQKMLNTIEAKYKTIEGQYNNLKTQYQTQISNVTSGSVRGLVDYAVPGALTGDGAGAAPPALPGQALSNQATVDAIRQAKRDGHAKEEVIADLVSRGLAQDVASRVVGINWY